MVPISRAHPYMRENTLLGVGGEEKRGGGGYKIPAAWGVRM